MKTRMILSFILIGVLAFAAGFATVAYFTSQATSEDNVFETGTLIIGVPNNDGKTAIFDIGNWQPGDSATESLTVSNEGSLDFKYKVTATFENIKGAALQNVLWLTITKGENEVIYDGLLSDLKDWVIPHIVEGKETGLAAGTSETLIFTVSLPTTVGNEYQGAAVEVNFVFDATQLNNPGWDQ